MVQQIDDNFVQLREQFLNLIVGCLMQILLLVITFPAVAFWFPEIRENQVMPDSVVSINGPWPFAARQLLTCVYLLEEF
jgi:uncharacterized membrane protein (DUF485 family)